MCSLDVANKEVTLEPYIRIKMLGLSRDESNRILWSCHHVCSHQAISSLASWHNDMQGTNDRPQSGLPPVTTHQQFSDVLKKKTVSFLMTF